MTFHQSISLLNYWYIYFTNDQSISHLSSIYQKNLPTFLLPINISTFSLPINPRTYLSTHHPVNLPSTYKSIDPPFSHQLIDLPSTHQPTNLLSIVLSYPSPYLPPTQQSIEIPSTYLSTITAADLSPCQSSPAPSRAPSTSLHSPADTAPRLRGPSAALRPSSLRKIDSGVQPTALLGSLFSISRDETPFTC